MRIETIEQACDEAGVPLSREQRFVLIGVFSALSTTREFEKALSDLFTGVPLASDSGTISCREQPLTSGQDVG